MRQDVQTADRNYQRGAIMGLTMAEVFILICFALLLLLAFWQWEVQKENTVEVQAFKNLSHEQKQAVLISTQDGSMEAFAALKEQGMDFSVLSGVEDPQDKWRFIDKDDLLRLTDAASKLPEDVQRDLADLVEANQAQKVLQEMAALEDLVKAGQTLEGISGKIREAEAQEAALVNALRSELGAVVAEMGGQIDETGAIILPDRLLFDQGKADITKSLGKFLQQACEPWLSVLRSSGVEISEVKIEGHASSEWRAGSTPSAAYLGNLDLSQRRSQAVLRTCLDRVKDPSLVDWARKHLIAVGYSSVRPIFSEVGAEDRAASRRVVFSATPNRKSLLDEIETEAQIEAGLKPESEQQIAPYQRSAFGGWVDTDGDCKNTRHELLEALSTGPVTFTMGDCAVFRGRWNDPYSGRIFRRAEDVQVDHLVPLKWAWDRGAHSWSEVKRATFANDEINLFVVANSENQSKGARGPVEWLPSDTAFHCQYVSRFTRVVKKYGLTMSSDEQTSLRTLLVDRCQPK